MSNAFAVFDTELVSLASQDAGDVTNMNDLMAFLRGSEQELDVPRNERHDFQDEKIKVSENDESSQIGIFQSSGYPRDCFASVPEDFVCGICREIVRNPLNLPCPHLFCENCFRRVKKSGNRAACPICRIAILVPELQHSSYSIKIISSLPIRCPYSGKGCNWTGTIGLKESILTNHLRNGCLWGGYEKCDKCGIQIRTEEKQDHILVCREVEAKCNCCDFHGMNKAVSVHKSIGDYNGNPCASMQHCSMAGCSTLIPINKLAHHLKFQCDKFMGICYGCEKQHSMPSYQLPSHIEEHKDDSGWLKNWVNETTRPAKVGDLRYLGYESLTYNFQAQKIMSVICRIVSISQENEKSYVTECIPGGVNMPNNNFYTSAPVNVSFHRNSQRPICDIALDCLNHHECSAGITGRRYLEQPFYECKTCTDAPNTGVCAVCAIDCHFGHELELSRNSDRNFCDCGTGNMKLVGIKHCNAAIRKQLKLEPGKILEKESEVKVDMNVRGNSQVELNISILVNKKNKMVIKRQVSTWDEKEGDSDTEGGDDEYDEYEEELQ